MLTDIQAVIFDLDGTLVDSMWVWAEIDRDFFRERNIPFPEFMDQDIEGMSFTETAEYFKRTFHLEESVEELKEIWNRMALEKYAHVVPFKPGAEKFLHLLREKNMKIGIATSNSNLLVHTFLEARQITDLIDAVTTSCDVNRGKPAPDVYLATAQKLQADPAHCLVFEDIPMGILAGKNAGMRVCAIADDYSAHQMAEKKEMADYFIEDYTQILEMNEQQKRENI